MEFTKKQIRPGVVALEMTGSITIGSSCKQVEQQVDGIIGQNQRWVIFDLSGVTYVDSAGMGTIVRSLCRLQKLGGTLRLTGVKGMVEGVLKLTQITRIIEIYPTAADAIQDLPPVCGP
ncbi:MAG TPA: STAS domain-containing protein [Terriglobia bacterium]|nr:STAS domain-containing protein [Terriglobia bacterium]